MDMPTTQIYSSLPPSPITTSAYDSPLPSPTIQTTPTTKSPKGKRGSTKGKRRSVTKPKRSLDTVCFVFFLFFFLIFF
jgi:hypothetical protein